MRWMTYALFFIPFLLSTADVFARSGHETFMPTNCKPGYLVITADEARAETQPPIVQAVYNSGFVLHKGERFALSFATLGDVQAFCGLNACDPSYDITLALRSYIQAAYQTALEQSCPIQYLLMVGPLDRLPHQVIWAMPEENIRINFSASDQRPHYVNKDAPPPSLNAQPHFTDLYYEDMDGLWDRNGNGVYAEVYNLIGSENCLDNYNPAYCDTSDLREYLPEIKMGRIVMRSLVTSEVAQVESTLKRIVDHQKRAPGWMKNLLFVAAPFMIAGDSAWLMEASKQKIESFWAEHPEEKNFEVETAYWHREGERSGWERCPFQSKHLCASSPMPDWTFEDPFDRNLSNHWFQYPEKYGVVFFNSHGNRDLIYRVVDGRYTQFWNAFQGHRSVWVSIACSNASGLKICLPDNYRYCEKVDFVSEEGEMSTASLYVPYQESSLAQRSGCPEGYIAKLATSYGDIESKDR